MLKPRIEVLSSVLLLTCACGPEDQLGESLDPLSIQYGVDYAWYRPSLSTLKSEGFKFVARYYSYDSSKNLSRGEADALIAAGFNIMGNWEEGATNALSGYNQGRSDATQARDEANNCGQPSDRPIYFSVDFDATPGEQTAINAYFDGVASVIGHSRTGAYGGFYPIERLFNDGKIAYGWQTYAWSGGQWDPRAQVRQVLNGIAGGQMDKDEAVASDFGQWGNYRPPTHGNVAKLGGRVAENTDGRLELVYRGTDNAVHHQWQTSAGGSWNGGASLGGDVISNPVIAPNADGRLEVFAVGTNKKVYTNFQTSPGGGWYGWIVLGTFEVQGDIAVAMNADGRLELFGRGLDDALVHTWQTAPNGDWSSWASLGGKISSSPVVGINADGRLEAFAVAGNTAFHIVQLPAGGWSGWINLGGSVTGKMMVGRNKDGREELFAVGTDNAVHHAWQTAANGDWGGWASLGGSVSSGPGVVLNPSSGNLEVFAEGSNGVLYHIWQNSPGGGWNTWQSLGDVVASSPAVGVNKDGVVEVFARSTAGHLEGVTRSGGTWEAAVDMGGSLSSF